MHNATATPKFVTAGKSGTENTPKTIRGVAKLDAYYVSYTDGKNEEQLRIVFKTPNKDAVFVINEKVGQTHIATASKPWFREEFCKYLEDNAIGGAEVKDAEDGVGSI